MKVKPQCEILKIKLSENIREFKKKSNSLKRFYRQTNCVAQKGDKVTLKPRYEKKTLLNCTKYKQVYKI